MKKKALRKDFYMEIKKTKNRFLSIFLIVALGVAFFAGIRATSPDMKLSADKFYTESNLMDIRVVSTLGLTDEDVEAIGLVSGVEVVEPSYSVDVLCEVTDYQIVVKLISNLESFNKITISEGRLPEKPNECLVDTAFIYNMEYKLGDTISVQSGTDDSIDETVTETEFTIVGTGSSSYYLSHERGASKIGNGTIQSFVVIPKETFNMDVYTEVYVGITGLTDNISYTDEYSDLVEGIVKNIEDIADSRCEIRYSDIMEEANTKIKDAEEEIAEGEQKLADAKIELEDGKQKLADAQKELAEKEEELINGEKKLLKNESELIDGKEKIMSGFKELEDGKAELASQRKTFESGKKEIEKNRKLLDDAKIEIAKNKKELEQGFEQLEPQKALMEASKKELAENKELLEAGKEEITLTESVLQENKEKLEQSKEMLTYLQTQPDNEEIREQIAILTEQINVAEAQFKEADIQLIAAKQQLAENEAALIAGEQELLIGETQLNEAEKKLKSGEKELLAGEKELLANEKELIKAEKELVKGEKLLAEGEKKLKDSEKLLIEKQTELRDGENKITNAKEDINEGKTAIEDAKIKLADGEKELLEGTIEYEDALLENEPKIADAKEDIKKAKKDLADLKEPTWYVLDRQSIQTYMEYGQDADRIGAIGKVFPIIFFLVAALVSLTSMTRMVEEERTQIGTLKALGYSKLSIASKYILYALLASVLGSLFGLIVGQKLFPFIIINAYGILYENLPYALTPLSIEYSITATLLAVSCTTIATISVCYKELKSNPSQLMRPMAPKSGKRIFIEKIPFVWNKLNFTKKATLRNLIRYKKRFFMTVFGIGGCMALLLLGFGIRDSIMLIGHLQFGKVKVYDSVISIEKDTTEQEKQTLYETLLNDDNITDCMFVRETFIDVGFEGIEKKSYIVVPNEPEYITEYMALQNRLTKERYNLDSSGVIITEKLANLFGVKKGDTIYLKEDNTSKLEVKVANIVENYFFHYVYITPDLYEILFSETPDYNQIITINAGKDTDYEERLKEAYMDYDIIADISFLSKTATSLDDMLKTMNTVIYVLVISAGLLAFVVLYNLNNINISERKRELATLKVLGFYDLEVSEYMYKENIWLTSIGSLLGIGLGMLLHKFIIVTVEIDIMMFGRSIELMSYVYSVVLTFVFSVLVNWSMHYSLKKIDMVESMKSVE